MTTQEIKNDAVDLDKKYQDDESNILSDKVDDIVEEDEINESQDNSTEEKELFDVESKTENVESIVENEPEESLKNPAKKRELSNETNENCDNEDSDENEDLFDDIGHETDDIPTEHSFFDTSLQNDLFITVTDPKKHVETMETYITYKLSTKTTRSEFDDSEYEVYRRYQDFVWLKNKLEAEYPYFIIPPLPSKFVVKSVMDRFSQGFIKTRCRALNNFMLRLSLNKKLSFSESLKIFLTATAPELIATKKLSGEGFMSRLGGSVKSLSQGGVCKNTDEFLSKESERTRKFKDKLSVLVRVAERVVEEKKSYADEIEEFAPTFASWASQENVIAPILTSLSECMESCVTASKKNCEKQQSTFLPPLQEYVLYADAVENLMKKRDLSQYNYEKIMDEKQRKCEERENLPKSDQSYSLGAMMGKSAEEVRQQKEKKLDQQILDVTARGDSAKKLLDEFTDQLKSEYKQWSAKRIVEIAQAFDEHAAQEIKYHQNCIEAFETVLPQLNSGSEVNSVHEG